MGRHPKPSTITDIGSRLFDHSSVPASSEQWLNPLMRKERPHFLQETGEGGFIFKDKVIAAWQ